MGDLNSFFLGWAYSEVFHYWSGLIFLVICVLSIVLSVVLLWFLLCAIDYVGDVKVWKACQCRASVKYHLFGVFGIVILKTFIMMFIFWLSFGIGWDQISHNYHILHYCIWLVFNCMLVWAYRSMNHFKSLGDCSGNLKYHKKGSKPVEA